MHCAPPMISSSARVLYQLFTHKPHLLKVTAASDLKSLAQLIPATSRLVLDPGPGMPGAKVATSVDYMEVSTATVRPGDIIRVLPGEVRFRLCVTNYTVRSRSRDFTLIVHQSLCHPLTHYVPLEARSDAEAQLLSLF